MNLLQPFVKLSIPNATYLLLISYISGDPDSPEVGQNSLNFSAAQITPGGYAELEGSLKFRLGSWH